MYNQTLAIAANLGDGFNITRQLESKLANPALKKTAHNATITWERANGAHMDSL